MITLKDVAEMAGVSPSTVSYVLSGKKKVKPETQERIDNAVRTLGYYPNLIASSLKTNRFMTVGVIAYDLDNHFVTNIVAKIESELEKRDYCMILCNSGNEPEQEEKCIRRLLSRNIDGLILIATGEKPYTELDTHGLPLVSIDRVISSKYYCVRTDNIQGGKMATEYLIGKGCRNILYLGNRKIPFAEERYEGYRLAMEKAGLNGYIHDTYPRTTEIEEMQQCLEKERTAYGEFDGVFASVDYFAVSAIHALKASGYNVPDKVKVIGHDNIDIGRFSLPAVTTVVQQWEEMSKLAVDNLMSRIAGEKPKTGIVLLDPYIIERESC